MKDLPVVQLDTQGMYKDNRYRDSDNNLYATMRLIEHAKDEPVFKIPLAAIYIGVRSFSSIDTVKELAEHCKRVMDTDLKYPVLLGPDGYIIDGWHRVIKALVEGRTTILAKRLHTLPRPDGKEENV